MQFIMSDISPITPDDEYSEVKECDYKGEHYSVRSDEGLGEWIFAPHNATPDVVQP